MITVKCHKCGRIEEVPDSYNGRVLECECGADVPVTQTKPMIQIPGNNKTDWICHIIFLCVAISVLICVGVAVCCRDFRLIAWALLSFVCGMIQAQIIHIIGSMELESRKTNAILLSFVDRLRGELK